ncbi:MAG: adenylate/guanylate cyclase domain-containing protein [Bdellovibrionaceae bacterium]|nr:adenylate/guanylate cyclase domain-containing protein [Bdellovibrionales bacterium]MCB9085419.1 adenylate/guanylate cyclase domain-containing protein [Pseudobdellovibrionaceae bacterium]
MTLIDDLRRREKLRELKAILGVITHKMVIPLFMAFWLCDLLYVPELKWEFLIARSLVIPLSLLTRWRLPKLQTFAPAQWLAFFYIMGLGAIINFMIIRIGDWSTPYYAGLGLVAIGSLSFVPWNWKFFSMSSMAIFGPYYIGAAMSEPSPEQMQQIGINSFFIVSFVVITLFLRYLTEQLRHKELESRQNLRQEIISRGKIIEEKTAEALKLSELSRQFSPQVVEAIRQNQVTLSEKVHRSNICAIFIDIVNSTERVTRIDKDRVDRVISRFMQDSARALLKYDITIDKFLGDGLLAFSNDPVAYDDYIERAIRASMEIREKFARDQEFYERNWLRPLEVRVGIASGFANVGFYGNEKYYHSYTAIGPVINLASRLCSAAKPSQILVPYDVVDALEGCPEFSFDFVGKRTLKGFGDDVIQTFEVHSASESHLSSLDALDCPSCNHVMHIDTNNDGIFVFKCRSCGHSIDKMPPSAYTNDSKKAA